jgi:hypothetical protein
VEGIGARFVNPIEVAASDGVGPAQLWQRDGLNTAFS